MSSAASPNQKQHAQPAATKDPLQDFSDSLFETQPKKAMYSDHKKKELNETPKREPNKNKPNKAPQSTQITPKNNVQKTNNNPIDQAIENLIQKRELPECEMRRDVMQQINRKKVDALYDGNYDEAQVLEDASQLIVQSECLNDNNCSPEEKNSILSQRQTQLMQHYRDQSNYWQQRIDKNEAKYNQELDELKEKQDQEIALFQEKWKSSDYVGKLHKPSNKVLQMRHIEKKLALQKKYAEAKQMKSLADKQQEVEEGDVQRVIELQMRNEYAALLAKQQQEVDKLEEYYDYQRERLDVYRKRSLEPIENAMKKVNLRKDLPMRMLKSRSCSQPTSTLPTPRTQLKFERYRTELGGSLRINPLKDSCFSGLPPSPAKQLQKNKRATTSQGSRVPSLT